MPEAEVPALVRASACDRSPLPLDRGLRRVRDALAQGVPPVVTAVGTFPELCAEYDLCEPVAPDDPAALADALVRTLTDPGCVRAHTPAWRGHARS